MNHTPCPTCGSLLDPENTHALNLHQNFHDNLNAKHPFTPPRGFVTEELTVHTADGTAKTITIRDTPLLDLFRKHH